MDRSRRVADEWWFFPNIFSPIRWYILFSIMLETVEIFFRSDLIHQKDLTTIFETQLEQSNYQTGVR